MAPSARGRGGARTSGNYGTRLRPRGLRGGNYPKAPADGHARPCCVPSPFVAPSAGGPPRPSEGRRGDGADVPGPGRGDPPALPSVPVRPVPAHADLRVLRRVPAVPPVPDPEVPTPGGGVPRGVPGGRVTADRLRDDRLPRHPRRRPARDLRVSGGPVRAWPGGGDRAPRAHDRRGGGAG